MPTGCPIGSIVSVDPGPVVEWSVSGWPVAYAAAVTAMQDRATAIADGRSPESVWLVEHTPLYTAGTSARPDDLREPRFPVHASGRGGQYTYHGPGQRVAYVMLDLRRRGPDVRAFVRSLEAWLTATLGRFAVRGVGREGRIGLWVERPDKPAAPDGRPAEDKIAAIGIRLSRWVSLHGVSLNVDPDLSHFGGIVPCGIADRHLGVTSLADLGHIVSMAEVDMALRGAFEPLFGPTRCGAPLTADRAGSQSEAARR